MTNFSITVFLSLVLCLLLVSCSDKSVSVKGEQNVDCRQIAEKIIKEEISNEELESKNFSYDEIAEILKQVAVIKGADSLAVSGYLKRNDQRFRINFKFGCEIEKATRGGAVQVVEKENGSEGKTKAWLYESNQMCDNDPSDVDWRFNFAPSWIDNPDDIRWWADSWLVRQAFSIAYGGNLLGSALCSCPLQLCIGTNGAILAGGVNNVKNNLYIWHK